MSRPFKYNDITYSYGDIEAVKGISFDVQPGEILGFLGPNGAGKSTTIKMLTGQMNPDSGSASVLGIDIAKDDPEMQAQIGVCFEEKNLYLNMSGIENLDFFASLFGIKDADSEEVLRRVGSGRPRQGPRAELLQGHASAHDDLARVHQQAQGALPR